MNFLKIIDMLSPPITLYFKARPKHASIISGILSIAVVVLVIASAIFYLLRYIHRDSPKAYFFTRYVDDAGNFPLNSSSMFNYIQFADKNDINKLGFDFNALVAVGTDSVYYEQYMEDPNILANFDYWIYGRCNFDSDIEGVKDIVNFSVLNNSACIRMYYDKEKDRYFNTGEEGFRWPILEKGCSNPLHTYYGLVVQRCDQAPEFIKAKSAECKGKAYIDEYISKIGLKYQIVDHYADMLNYKTPFIKYFYELTSAVSDQQFIINHLNFNPADMLTHNGNFFDNIEEEHSYFYTQNEKHVMDQSALLMQNKSTNGCLIGIYFWMQNTLQQYERHYDRFQDLLSDIGGIGSIISTVAMYVNLLISSYVTILDTKELIKNREKVNYGNNRNFQKKPTIFKGIAQVENNPPKRQIKSRKIQIESNSINLEDLKDNEVNIYNYSRKNKEENSYGNMKDSREIEKMHFKNKDKISLNDEKKGDETQSEAGDQYSDNNNNDAYIEDNNIPPQKEEDSKVRLPSKNKDFSWFSFICHLITCFRSNKNIEYYRLLRRYLISEENIIQIYLDIYGLLKLKNIPKKDLFMTNK